MEIVTLAILLIIAAICAAIVIIVLRNVTMQDEEILAQQAAEAAADTTEEAEQSDEAQADGMTEEQFIADAARLADDFLKGVDESDDTDEAAVAAVAEEAPVIPDGDAVTFSATNETLSQKYEALSDEMRGYYDEIVAAASAVEGNRCFKNDRYEEYKVGKNSIVRLLIKRGIIVCEFVIANSDLRNYMADNKLKVKQAPTTLKVFDEATLAAAKQTMTIAVKAIEEEKLYKKEQARAKRKAAKAAAEAAQGTATDAE